MANVFVFDTSYTDSDTTFERGQPNISSTSNAVYVADWSRNNYFDTGIQFGDPTITTGTIEQWS